MKDDYTTDSHYLAYTFLFGKVGRMQRFYLGSERVRVYFSNLGLKGY